MKPGSTLGLSHGFLLGVMQVRGVGGVLWRCDARRLVYGCMRGSVQGFVWS